MGTLRADSGSLASDSSGDGNDGGGGRSLLDLPDAMLSEIFANFSVKVLGRASCACRHLRGTSADERLWVALWEGPLPGGFSRGIKAAHAALWLLAKGDVEQTRVAVCEPPAPARHGADGGRLGAHDRRTASRRRVGEAITAANSNGTPAASTARARGEGGGVAGWGGGGGVVGAGFPVHVSCMAISGGVIAAAAGTEITVWDMEEAAVPRARFHVSGHGSVTCLLLRRGTLLAGDNSGYLRCYDLGVRGGRARHEIRTHADRVTAMDAFTLPDGNSSVDASGSRGNPQRDGMCSSGGNQERHYRAAGPASAWASGDAGGSGAGGRQQRRWDQGHGWGDGWLVDSSEEQDNARSGAAAAALTAEATPPRDIPRRGSGDGALSSWGALCLPHAAGGAAGGFAGFGRGRGRTSGLGHGLQGGLTGVRASTLGAPQGGSSSGRAGGLSGGSSGGLHGGSDRRYRSMHGGGGGGGSGPSPGEPSSRLGKRQGYAGRGQRDEPSDAAFPSPPGRETVAWGRGRGRGRGGGGGGGGGGLGGEYGLSSRSALSSGAAASAWDEEEENENDQGWGGEEEKQQRAGCQGGNGRRRGIGEQGGDGAEDALLFTGSDDGTAKAWDSASGRLVRVYAGHTKGVTCLQATHTESYGPVLVTGGGDSAVIVWELMTGSCLEKLETGTGLIFNPGGVGPRVGCLQAYNDCIVVGEDRHISVWSLRKGQRPQLSRASFCEHQRPIRRLDVVGRWIVTCAGDYVIRLWDSKTGVCVRELGTKSGAAITCFRLSGLRLLTTSLFDASVLMTSFMPPSALKGLA